MRFRAHLRSRWSQVLTRWGYSENLGLLSLFLTSLFTLLATYLSLALALSISVVSATFIVDILATILLSTLLLRLIELVASAQSLHHSGLQFCMEVGAVALLLPSIGLEVISIGFRSFSLGFRIFANVSAGHVLSDIALVSRYLPLQGGLSALWSFGFSTFLVIYETLVALIQLGVFLSLLAVYVE